jgi:hypothetical protein
LLPCGSQSRRQAKVFGRQASRTCRLSSRSWRLEGDRRLAAITSRPHCPIVSLSHGPLPHCLLSQCPSAPSSHCRNVQLSIVPVPMVPRDQRPIVHCPAS